MLEVTDYGIAGKRKAQKQLMDRNWLNPLRRGGAAQLGRGGWADVEGLAGCTEKRTKQGEDEHRHCAAAAAAKLLQSCPTLCIPIDGSPPDSSVRGIFQARVLEWGAIAFSHCVTNLHP